MVNPLKTTKEEKGNNSTHNEGELISKIYHIKADDKKAEDVVSSEKEKKNQRKGIFFIDNRDTSTFLLDKQYLLIFLFKCPVSKRY